LAKRYTLKTNRQSQRNPPSHNLPFLQSFTVSELFGKYSFPVINFNKNDENSINVSFLFGENGIGKTTILRLLYALLSSSKTGNKTLLASTKFRFIRAEFSDGQAVTAYREPSTKAQSYFIEISGPRANYAMQIIADDDGDIVHPDHPDLEILNSALDTICPTILHISDQRRIKSSYEPWAINHPSKRKRIQLATTNFWNSNEEEPDIDLSASSLSTLLEEAQAHLVRRAISGTAKANMGAGQVYLTVAKTIAGSGNENKEIYSDYNVQDLFLRISILEDQILEYGRYGLIQGDNLTEIRTVLEFTEGNIRNQILTVLEPYISSIEQRVETNYPLMEQMAAFERGLNRLLRRKTMYVRVEQPILLIDDEGHILDVNALSSGERHLLYLCTVSMLSRERQSILIIDEPELSLNHKWQRSLVDVLTSISGGRSQYIMATHSFEIISKYRDSAVELEPYN
jgi:predicted ATPase